MFTKDVANKFGLSRTALDAWRKQLGIKPQRIPNRRHRFTWSEAEISMIGQAVKIKKEYDQSLNGLAIRMAGIYAFQEMQKENRDGTKSS